MNLPVCVRGSSWEALITLGYSYYPTSALLQLHNFRPKAIFNMTGNVGITYRWGEFVQPLLRWKSNKYMIYEIIYLPTAIGLTPGGSSTAHIYTQTIHRRTQLIWKECGPCPVFASYPLAFALQLRKKHGRISVRVAEECQLARWKEVVR